MRIVDLADTVAEATEQLQTAAIARSSYINSCHQMLPEEVCTHISNLCQLARLASTLAELAADAIGEDV